MSTKVITSSITLEGVQLSIVQETVMQTNEGPVVVKPKHVDSSYITLKIVLVMGGKFDESKTDVLLMTIFNKLAEIEL